MGKEHVVFVGFSEQDNLGIGYIASVLLDAGIQPVIIDFRLGPEAIRDEILACRPLLVGFSIIFQYHIYEFRDLIVWLRQSGIRCHFTAGGHYPSLRYRDLLALIPELDSVVLFEGEHTCLDLVRSLAAGEDWHGLQGIAYLDDGHAVATPPRPLEPNLDVFPPPVRPPLRDYVLHKKHATILAGRGCLYHCSFCSIRQFYSAPPGPLKRLRRPEMVVREMELLHRQKDCAVFMFQDDDFPLAHAGKPWAAQFCDLLESTGLAGAVLWKANCRPDEIDRQLFTRMRNCGLYLVYLGIECGTNAGLSLMNKHMTVETTIRGVQTLKEVGIQYDYGFMLFDPGSTYASVLANIDFLERICGDGSSPITFCKMLPYAETQIEQQLLTAGRLKGRDGFRDYSFLDPSLDYFYAFLSDAFNDWVGSHDGVLNLARWTRYYLAVARQFYPETPGLDEWEKQVRNAIAESNQYFFRKVRSLAQTFQAGSVTPGFGEDAAQEITFACSTFKRRFHALIRELEAKVVYDSEPALAMASARR